MKLNRKGYMLVEIILASVLAFSIAFFLLNLIYKFKDTSDSIQHETEYEIAKNIITKNIMTDLEKGSITDLKKENNTITFKIIINNIPEDRRLFITEDTITYGKIINNNFDINDISYYIKQIPSSSKIDINNITIEETNSFIGITIPMNSIYDTKNYNINLLLKKNSTNYTMIYEGIGSTLINDNLIAKFDGIHNTNDLNHSNTTNIWYSMKDNNYIANITDGAWEQNCLVFNGNTTTARLNNTTTTNKVTIEIVTTIEEQTPAANINIISNWDAGGSGIYITKEGNLSASLYINDDYKQIYGPKINYNTKYHFALTYDGTNAILYINGNQAVSKKIVGNIVSPTTGTQFTIGCNPKNVGCDPQTSGGTLTYNYLKGKVYSFAIFNEALTPEQIAADYGTKVSFNENIQTLPTPTRYNKAFAGWYSEINYTNQLFSTTKFEKNEDTTIYAKWKN